VSCRVGCRGFARRPGPGMILQWSFAGQLAWLAAGDRPVPALRASAEGVVRDGRSRVRHGVRLAPRGAPTLRDVTARRSARAAAWAAAPAARPVSGNASAPCPGPSITVTPMASTCPACGRCCRSVESAQLAGFEGSGTSEQKACWRGLTWCVRPDRSTIVRPQGSAALCLAHAGTSRRASRGLAGDPAPVPA
jgi:hypothetical protein